VLELTCKAKFKVHNMPCILQEWLQEIVCKYVKCTEFEEIGWIVVQDVLKLLAAKGRV
jgi:hypothetical protein